MDICTCDLQLYFIIRSYAEMASHSIKARSLPRFWFFSFHYIDYQKYAFELLTNVNTLHVSRSHGLNPTSLTLEASSSHAQLKLIIHVFAHIRPRRRRHVPFLVMTSSIIWILGPSRSGSGLRSLCPYLSFIEFCESVSAYSLFMY